MSTELPTVPAMWTTLKLLRAHDACKDQYKLLRENLGRGYGDETPIPLLRVLESNGLSDALWGLRAVPAEQSELRDRLAREFACDCAERVLPIFEARYPDDKRPRQAIETARKYARGEASIDALLTARRAADDAANDAADGDVYGEASAGAYAASATYAATVTEATSAGLAAAGVAAYASATYAATATSVAAADGDVYGNARKREWANQAQRFRALLAGE